MFDTDFLVYCNVVMIKNKNKAGSKIKNALNKEKSNELNM